jgi:hypothetical protein
VRNSLCVCTPVFCVEVTNFAKVRDCETVHLPCLMAVEISLCRVTSGAGNPALAAYTEDTVVDTICCH